MACNCKKAAELEEKYGTEIEESILKKAYRGLWKLFVLSLGVVIGIVAVPVVIFILMFNQIFMGGKGIKFPEKLSKYIS